MPYLDLHFAYKQVSENLFPHGVSNKERMWDLQFIYPDRRIYDKKLQLVQGGVNEGQTLIPQSLNVSVAPFVNLGVFEEYEPSRKFLKLHFVDMKKFTKITVIQESTLIPNTSPSLYGSCDFSTFPNGDVVVMNYPTDTMTLYDKKGKYKKSITGVVNVTNQNRGYMEVHQRKGIIALQYKTGFKFYNKNLEFLFQISTNNIENGFRTSGFYPNGDLLIGKQNQTYTRLVIDYTSKTLVTTYTTPLTSDQRDTIYLVRIEKDTTFFQRAYRGIGKSTLLEFDKNMKLISETTPPYDLTKLVSWDGKYYHTKEENGAGGLYKTFEVATNQLVLQFDMRYTLPSVYGSLRGQSETYGSYQ
ncbi:hypothetical protein AB1I92_07875 [Bacillus mobilis]|uniref:Uncharacterized protein n=2 Tax=Bacillus cereus group TaxID=86661 RepID=A0A1C4CAS2_BACCE|nr:MULTISPECIES: hypothetical protein [Bacillus cereus group]OKA34366.1 hypothetical protein BJR07_22870 [Bacillus cereus]OKA38135.1 hypothetical protein BJR06_11860 [Bacillus cereus]SCC16247.1 Uncharacterized protein BC0861_02325 [Bacillus mobilis]